MMLHCSWTENPTRTSPPPSYEECDWMISEPAVPKARDCCTSAYPFAQRDRGEERNKDEENTPILALSGSETPQLKKETETIAMKLKKNLKTVTQIEHRRVGIMRMVSYTRNPKKKNSILKRTRTLRRIWTSRQKTKGRGGPTNAGRSLPRGSRKRKPCNE